MIAVRAFPRMHLGLLDLGHVTPRAYGGAGFSIDSFPIEVAVERSDIDAVSYAQMIDPEGRRSVEACVKRFYEATSCSGFKISVLRMPLQHVGFGTKTSLLLAVLKGLDLVAQTKLSDETLKKLSGRGGTSGSGINLFFQGGLVVELGHEDRIYDKFSPSSAVTPVRTPPLACHVKMPDNWAIYLLLPDGRRLNGVHEQAFFSQNTPIPRSEVLESIAATYHGILPAVLSGNIPIFRESLNTLHRVGFKSRELAAQSEAVRSVYEEISKDHHCAVGLSSLGPLLFVIAERGSKDGAFGIQKLRASQRAQVQQLGVCSVRNAGFEVMNA